MYLLGPVLALLCLCSMIFAQTQYRLSGLITDDSGAVVVGALVIARNAATGVVNEATTKESGN